MATNYNAFRYNVPSSIGQWGTALNTFADRQKSEDAMGRLVALKGLQEQGYTPDMTVENQQALLDEQAQLQMEQERQMQLQNQFVGGFNPFGGEQLNQQGSMELSQLLSGQGVRDARVGALEEMPMDANMLMAQRAQELGITPQMGMDTAKLSALSQMNPELAQKLAFPELMKKPGRATTGNKRLEQELRILQAPIQSTITDLESRIWESEPNSPERAALEAEHTVQVQEYNATGGKPWSGPVGTKFVKALEDEVHADLKDRLANKSDLRSDEKVVKDAIKINRSNWQSTNKPMVVQYKQLGNMHQFIEEAKLGNAIARKNFIAGMSRLGSNEALSDSEMSLMMSRNLGDQLDGKIQQYFGKGSAIDDATFKKALEAFNRLVPKRIEQMEKAESKGFDSLNDEFNGRMPRKRETILFDYRGELPKLTQVSWRLPRGGSGVTVGPDTGTSTIPKPKMSQSKKDALLQRLRAKR